MRAHPAGPLHGAMSVPDGIGPAPDDVNALDPSVWPQTAERVDGEVHLGGRSVSSLAHEHGTPLYALDEEDFRARSRAFQSAFADMDVFYAAKSFLCSAVVRWVDEDGLGLDVCTEGELQLALRAGLRPERIAFHGNNKSARELRLAVQSGVGRIVVDSFDEISRLATIAEECSVEQTVLVRVTAGVEAHTHEFIATAHEDQKFGFSIASGAAMRAVDAVLAAPALRLRGLHSHIGSQIFDMSGFEVAAQRVVQLLAQIRDKHGIELEEIDLGGGLGIAYISGDDPPAPDDIAQALRTMIDHECTAHGLAVPRGSIEPGRAISGPPTITIYEVGTVKPVTLERETQRLYVSVDGGMSDNVRTAMYDAEYTCVLASRESSAPPVPARVVGKHCESGDIVVRDLWLPSDVRPGDLLAVAATGAYCRAMASNYNLVGRPPVVGVRDGRTSVLIRRETIDDILAFDTGLDLDHTRSDATMAAADGPASSQEGGSGD